MTARTKPKTNGKTKTTPRKRITDMTREEIRELEMQSVYGRASIDGEKQAELYLHELRLQPSYLGMPLLGSYVSQIKDYPKDERVKGQLVGFFSRVEQEFGRMLMEDAWRASSWQDKWAFVKSAADRRAKGAR